MRRRAAFPAALACVVCVSTPLAAQAIPADVRASVRARVDNGWSPGIVVGVVDGGRVEFFAYGRTSPRDGAPIDEHTVFEIGSITKLFTSLALADMAVKGELRLDDPVAALLPDSFAVPTRDGVPITLRLLALHRSGLPELPGNMSPQDPANPYADYDQARLAAFLRAYALPRAPGAGYAYSNVGAGLLGFALATRARTGFEALLRSRVLDPLGMMDTHIALTPEISQRLARGHTPQGETAYWDFDVLAGAGALRSTAADLTRFLSLALGEESALAPALRLTLSEASEAGPDAQVGLGWMFRQRGARRIAWSGGRTGGFRSFIGLDPSSGLGVVVLSNSMEGVDDVAFHLLDPTLPLMTVRAVVPLPLSALEEYVGEYRTTTGQAVRVRIEGNDLVAQVGGVGTAIIYPSALDQFFARTADAQVTFLRDEAGRVGSLVLRMGGRDTVAERVP